MGSVHISGKNQRSICPFPSSIQWKVHFERARFTILSEHKIKLLKRQLPLLALKKIANAWNSVLCYFFQFSIHSVFEGCMSVNTETTGCIFIQSLPCLKSFWVQNSQIWMHKSRKNAPARKGASKCRIASRDFLGQSLKQLWLEIWPRVRGIITNLEM